MLTSGGDWSAGLTVLDDLQSVSDGLASGDWLNVTLGTVSGGASLLDPIGTLAEQGAGWLIEHLQPLKGWLEELTGSPGQVQALAGAWDQISTDLTASSEAISGFVRLDLADFEGNAVEAYRTLQARNTDLLNSIAGTSAAISAGLANATQMVQMVYELTRDVIAIIVGMIIGALLTSWIPVYGQARLITEVAEVVGKYVPTVAKSIETLIGAFEKLQELLRKAATILRAIPAHSTGVVSDVAGKSDEAIDLAAAITQRGDDAAEVAGDVAHHANSATDVVPTRPTWRQSEIDALDDFPDYADQKSFINGEEVPYGTKGSSRPDLYTDGHSVEVKNYNVESASGRSNLVRTLVKQYEERLLNLPPGTRQTTLIDVRGQNASDDLVEALADKIAERTDGGLEILFKRN